MVGLRGRTSGSSRSKDSPLKVFEVVGLRGQTLGLLWSKESPLRVFEVVGLRVQIGGLVGSLLGTTCGLNSKSVKMTHFKIGCNRMR